MLKRYQSQIITFGRLADLLAIGMAWLASYPLRFYVFSWIPHKGIPSFWDYSTLLLMIFLLWPAVLSGIGVYEEGKFSRRTEDVLLALKGHFVAMLLFTTLTFFISEARLSRGVLIVFAVNGALGIWFGRMASRIMLYKFFKAAGQRANLGWVGESTSIRRILDWFGRYPEFGIEPKLAFKDGNLAEWISKNNIQVLLVRHRPGDELTIQSVHQVMKDLPIDVWVIPDFEEYLGLGAVVTQFREVPLIEFNVPNISNADLIAKRIFDFVSSAIGLIILSPFLFVVGVLVKLTSPGPVLYRQERMGLDGKTFKILKFRSMGMDAEKDGAVWAKEGDHRRTRFGSFLRSTSIDELPQLWNVFVGDMSLVGPRPERPVFVGQFKKDIPNYMLRHKMKAGITGWAQVNGWRGNTSLEKRIEYDLFYIRNWSLWMDIKILFLTLFKGFVNPNAY